MLRCERCQHEDVSAKKYPCSKCDSVINDLFEPKKQTNAERIRSMSDEELAEFMANKGGYIACRQCDFFNHDEEKCESPSGWICTKGYAAALIQK